MSEKEYREAIEAFGRLPRHIRNLICEDVETAFINRVKAMKRVLRLE